MKNINCLLFFLILISSCGTEKKSTQKKITIEKGISFELAKYRKQQITDVFYQLDFSIPKEKTKTIVSKLKLELTLKNVEDDLILDFNENASKLKAVIVNRKKVEINHQKEHLIIAKKGLVLGENTLEIVFDAGETSLNRSSEFLYTLLVPDRASTLFPCFDQPDIKANYQLTITAPKDWKVLCGAFEKNTIKKGDFTEHQFGKTDLMSTYLFSFAAGKFTEENKNPGSFNMRFLYRENDQEKISESIEEVFKIHQNAIDFLEEYTTVKFPFQKMDFAAIPPFQYGGMEHVGAIQYRESSLFLDKNATQNQKLGRAKLIAHETAHMWFGNLVTMRWFDDVWLKEVFANFMADKIMNPVFPEINHSLNFMMEHYPSAYSEDRTKGTNAIRQNLDNLKNAGSLYGRIIYNKAPIMMRQLENILGEKAFQKGMQEYVKTYANANADWNELVTILDKNASEDIKKWSDVWVNSSGRPIFSNAILFDENDKITSFIITQNAEDGSDKIWPQSFNISLVYDTEIKVINAKIVDKQLSLTEAVGLPKPNQIIYNSNGFGYGVFPIDKHTIHEYKNVKNEVSRAYSYINLYENMLTGTITSLEAYQTYLDAITQENNELIYSYLSDRINVIFWDFLTDNQQKTVQQKTENQIFNLLEKKLPANIKQVLFGLYKSIAISSKGLENLYAIWNKEKTIENLVFNENDYIGLANKLAIYKHPKAVEILKIQQKNITNKDRLERFNWLLPSLSNDKNVRDEFMISLLQKENREKESWVESALYNIHHPIRQKNGIKHLKSILEKLEEVQITGDIFFPKAWLSSSIGNYTSIEAFAILETFLNQNPNYNPILKKKLLQVTDNLYRAQKIKK